MMAPSLSAQTVWDGGGGNDNWSTAANWQGDAVPANGSTAAVTFAGSTRLTPFLDQSWTLLKLVFETGAGAFTLSGNSTLSLGANGLYNNSANTETIATNLTLTASQPWSTSSGNLVVSGVVASTGAYTLTKDGSNALTLSGNNTYTGTTTVSNGTLIIGHNNALGASTLRFNGGTVQGDGTARTLGNGITGSSGTFAGSSNLTFTGALTGEYSFNANITNTATTTFSGDIAISTAVANGTLTINATGGPIVISGNIANGGSSTASPLTKLGSGTLTLSGTNTYGGNTIVGAGTVIIGSNNALGTGTLRLQGGTLQGDGSARTISNAANLVQNSTIGGSSDLTFSGAVTTSNTSKSIDIVNTGTTTFSGSFGLNLFNNTGPVVLSGTVTSGFVKSGTGTLTISGANGYGGTTNLTAGTLVVSNNGALGTGTLSLNGGTLQGDGSARTLSNAVTLAADSTIGGSSDITLSGMLTNSNADHTLTVSNSGTTTFSGTVDLSNTSTNRTLTINNAGAVVISGVVGNDLASTGSALVKDGSGTLTLSANNTYGGGTTINAGTLQVGAGGTSGSISGNVTNNGALAFNRSNSLTYSGVISGTGALTQAGSGTLTLSAANTFNGPTTISAGTLKLGHASALQNSTVSVSGGALGFGTLTSATLGGLAGSSNITLANDNSATVALTVGGTNSDTTYSGVLSGSGTLIKNGSGTLTLYANNTFTGTTTVNAGSVKIGYDNSLKYSTVSLGVDNGLTYAPYDTVNILSPAIGGLAGTGNLTLPNNRLYVGYNNDNTSYSGVISGSAELHKVGTGTLALSGTSTYSGGTIIEGGLIQFNSLGNFGTNTILLNGGGVKWAPGTTTDISSRLYISGGSSGTLDTNGNDVTLSSTIGGTGGALNKSGNGMLTLAANNNLGSPTISGGTLRISSDSNIGSTGYGINLTLSGGTLQPAASFSLAHQIVVNSGGGTIDTNGYTLTLPTYSNIASGTGTLTKAGAGTLVMVGSSDYTTFSGNVSVNAGTIQFANSNNFGTGNITLNGGGLRVNGDFIGDFSSHLTLGSSGGTFDTNGHDYTFASAVGGSGGLVKSGSGTLTFSAANTYGGTTTLSAGTLKLSHASALQNSTLSMEGGTLSISNSITAITVGGLSGAGNVALANSFSSSVALTVGSNGASTTYSGVLSGSGNLTKSGSGTLMLSGTNTYGSGTTISAGTLQLGSTGALPSAGAVTLGGGTLATGGLTPAATLGALTLLSSSTLDFGSGTSALSFANSSGISWSGTLTIANYTSGTDTLRFGSNSSGLTSTQLGLINFGGGLTATIDSLGYVTASAIPEPSTYAALAGAAVLGLATWRRQTSRRLKPELSTE